ncbi:MAG: RsbRD N-terminal domain-containing protein [Syntrophobacterales bacterium]|nr:RsbRD N-terminal domain-containing protein [Syntrophobacterales bacterium]
MRWVDTLERNKQKVIETWFQKIIETYPEETAKFLKAQKNPFLNPVGGAIREGLEGIVNWIISGGKSEEVIPFLDRIIRIRAIQEFKPSEALQFIIELKVIIRNICSQESSVGLEAVDALVDKLLMESFDVFSKCREDLYEIRVQEIKDKTFRLLQRAGVLYEISPESEQRDR